MPICHPGVRIVPVLRAAALDIRSSQTHTHLMLSLRLGTLGRMLTLMGLVLAFVFVAGDGWAADDLLIYREEVNGANVGFPYLSPIQDQRHMLLNVFTIQTKLFNAINSPVEGMEALKYLALAATLLGAILVGFNSKLRKLPVLGPWLLILIMCLFAPYGSKLLFYPLTSAGVTNLVSGEETAASQDCGQSEAMCGFTPQLAAIHVASVLQLTFSDLFNSVGWSGLLDDVARRSALERSQLLVASPEWSSKVKDFGRKCGLSADGSFDGVIAQRMAHAGASSSSNSLSSSEVRVVTFGEMWNRFARSYALSYGANTILYPPQAIVLYDEESPEYKDWPVDKEKYTLGLTEFYSQYVGTGKKVKDRTSSDFNTASNVSIKDALDELGKTSLFRVGEEYASLTSRGGLYPGFFIARRTSSGISGSDVLADYRRCYNRGAGCWNTTGTPNLKESYATQQAYLGAVFNGNLDYQPSYRDMSWYNPIDPFITSYSYEPWRQLLEVINNPNGSVMTMPVGVINFKIADLETGEAQRPTIVEGTNTSSVVECSKEGNILIDESLNWTLSSVGNAPEMEPLRKILVNNTSLTSDELTLNQIANPVLNGTDDEKNNHCKVWWNAYGGVAGRIADALVESSTDACLERLKSERDLVNNLIKTYSSELNDLKVRKQKIGSAISAQDKYKLLLTLVIGGIQSSTSAYLPDTQAEAIAGQKSQEIDIKENSGLLTYVGGGVAKFLGNIFLKVGSFFTGPLSATIVYFLSMFVDLALLSLIVLTPILFLISLAMPSAAMGVLTISVMGAFILKAVPITLLIVNALSRLVYFSIGGAQSANSEQMKELITLAAAGLYANLVGLTFFLLFKLGDASAVLSRFTALDNSASKIAEAGWNATKAAAALALLPVGGAIGGAIGSRFAAAAAARAGAPAELINVLRNAQQGIASDKLDEKGGKRTTVDGKPLLDTQGNAFSFEEEKRIGDNHEAITEAMKPLEEGGLGLSEQEASELYGKRSLTDQYGRKFSIGADGKPVWDANTTPASDLDLENRGGLLSSQQVSEREAGQKADMEYLKANAVAQDIQTRMPQDARKAAEVEQITAAGIQAVNENLKAEANAVAYDVATGKPQSAAQAQEAETAMMDRLTTPKPAAQLTDSATPVGGGVGNQNAGVAGGVASQVTVAGGRLDGVGTIDSMGASSEMKSPEQERAERVEAKRQEMLEEQQARDSISVDAELKNLKKSSELSESTKQKLDTVDASDPEKARRQIASILQAENTTMSREEAKRIKANNLNQQYADRMVEFEQKWKDQLATIAEKDKNGDKLSSFERRVKDTHEKLQSQDPAGLVLGEQAKAMANVERLQASLDARFGADNVPGWGKSAASGFYGALAGGGGGLAKIPVIGTAVGEALNEFYQAPERARAWQSFEKRDASGKVTRGGFGGWWSAQGDAKRMGFFQKEMAPLGAATQYQQMMSVGGFQAQAEIARQAAAEAVAKSRTQFEGMLAERKGAIEANISVDAMNMRLDDARSKINAASVEVEFSNDLKGLKGDARKEVIEKIIDSKAELQVQGDILREAYSNGPLAMSAQELAGLGRHETAARIGSIRNEANIAQEASLKVKTLKAGLDSDMKLRSGDLANLNLHTEESRVFLTPDMLATMHGNMAVKSAGSRADELMAGNYGILEKQYLRGKSAWDATRGMAFNRKAAGRFTAEDVDTDYLVAGHLKMVQGKEAHMERLGQYNSLVKYRHESNKIVSEFLQKQLGDINSGIRDAMKSAGIGDNVSSTAWSTANRDKMEKWAKEQLTAKGTNIPLEAVFNVAQVNGGAKYDQKVMTAVYEASSQNAENWVKTQKAASAALSAKLTDVQNFTKKISFEKDGVKFSIGSATEKLFEKFDMALGSRATEAITLFNDYFSKGNRQKTAFDIGLDKSKKNPHGWMRVDKAEFENYLNELNKNSPGLADQIRTRINDGKTFQEKNGKIEWGYVDEKGEF